MVRKGNVEHICLTFFPVFFSGGLALQGNPWRCSCENIWLGSWLRRWMRETLQLHTSVAERGQTIQSIVRTITCYDPENVLKKIPIVDLDTSVKCYDEKKISHAAPGSKLSAVIAGFMVLLTVLLR